ncbi:MAG: threonine/serine exporter [Bacteroidales bacterium]|nr:threonine/serine exporter [Bacteroidales bacterium]
MISEILSDAFFAAIAAIGFAAISNPPRNAYVYCALIAAVGHSVRYILMSPAGLSMSIVPASGFAALLIGFLAVLLSPVAKTPSETFLFPSLLPMIPGIYAYKTFGGLAMCLIYNSESSFIHYFYLFTSNGLTCSFIILAMVVGSTIPIFMLKRISFKATRS